MFDLLIYLFVFVISYRFRVWFSIWLLLNVCFSAFYWGFLPPYGPMILTTAGKFCKTRLHKVLWRFLLGRISLYFGRYPNEMISAKYFLFVFIWTAWMHPVVLTWQLMSWFSLGFTHPLMVIGAIKRQFDWFVQLHFVEFFVWEAYHQDQPRPSAYFLIYTMCIYHHLPRCGCVFNDMCSSLYVWIVWVTTRELFILVGKPLGIFV